MEDILSVVRASLVSPPSTITIPATEEVHEGAGGTPQIFLEEEQKWDDNDEGSGGGPQELVYPHEDLFDDMGEGVGVEGDLDMEEE
jgi:hypothetical protein